MRKVEILFIVGLLVVALGYLPLRQASEWTMSGERRALMNYTEKFVDAIADSGKVDRKVEEDYVSSISTLNFVVTYKIERDIRVFNPDANKALKKGNKHDTYVSYIRTPDTSVFNQGDRVIVKAVATFSDRTKNYEYVLSKVVRY